jgi:hypothetical protein
MGGAELTPNLLKAVGVESTSRLSGLVLLSAFEVGERFIPKTDVID